jgi:hypothetical protein
LGKHLAVFEVVDSAIEKVAAEQETTGNEGNLHEFILGRFASK